MSIKKNKSKKYISPVNESSLLRSSENARLTGVIKHDNIMLIVFKNSQISLNLLSGYIIYGILFSFSLFF
jgi:hypothetical protein